MCNQTINHSIESVIALSTAHCLLLVQIAVFPSIPSDLLIKEIWTGFLDNQEMTFQFQASSPLPMVLQCLPVNLDLLFPSVPDVILAEGFQHPLISREGSGHLASTTAHCEIHITWGMVNGRISLDCDKERGAISVFFLTLMSSFFKTSAFHQGSLVLIQTDRQQDKLNSIITRRADPVLSSWKHS